MFLALLAIGSIAGMSYAVELYPNKLHLYILGAVVGATIGGFLYLVGYEVTKNGQ